jgi:hypothetical protein
LVVVVFRSENDRGIADVFCERSAEAVYGAVEIVCRAAGATVGPEVVDDEISARPSWVHGEVREQFTAAAAEVTGDVGATGTVSCYVNP